MASKLSKLVKVSEDFRVYRYDNGWMFEVSGRDKKGDCVTAKVVCNTEDEVLALVKDYNALDLDC